MKKIIRMIVFSGIALYLTSLWNKGFIIKFTPVDFLQAAIIVALIYYIIAPLFKIILLPLNFLTLGIASVVFYIVLFYLVFNKFSILEIRQWQFQGADLGFINIPAIKFRYWENLVASSFSISIIINLLELIL